MFIKQKAAPEKKRSIAAVAITRTGRSSNTAKAITKNKSKVKQKKVAAKNNLSEQAILEEIAGKPENQMTGFEKIELIAKGISKKDLEHLKKKTTLDYHQLARILSVARATLINKKGSEKFDATLSEKILSMADIYSYGYEVFEDRSRFNEWIFSSNRSLGGQRPYDLLNSQYGREEIKNLIGRIEYGVYS